MTTIETVVLRSMTLVKPSGEEPKYTWSKPMNKQAYWPERVCIHQNSTNFSRWMKRKMQTEYSNITIDVALCSDCNMTYLNRYDKIRFNKN